MEFFASAFWTGFLWPLIIMVAESVLLLVVLFAGKIGVLPLLGLVAAALVGVASVAPLWKRKLNRTPLFTWGMVLAHFGIAVALFGVAVAIALFAGNNQGTVTVGIVTAAGGGFQHLQHRLIGSHLQTLARFHQFNREYPIATHRPINALTHVLTHTVAPLCSLAKSRSITRRDCTPPASMLSMSNARSG